MTKKTVYELMDIIDAASGPDVIPRKEDAQEFLLELYEQIEGRIEILRDEIDNG